MDSSTLTADFQFSEDPIICELTQGKSFVDIGGLWGTVREKVTVALAAGASNAAMMDITYEGHQLWNDFHSRAASKGFAGKYRSISANLDDQKVPQTYGTFDIVHCSGIIYHAPSPFHTLMRLRALTNEYLILGSMTVAEKIETSKGSINMAGGAAYFIPALSGLQFDIFQEYLEGLGLNVHNINTTDQHPWMFSRDEPNYGPWWWLWTPDTIAKMAEVAGFKSEKIVDAWPGRSHNIVLRAV